MTQGINRKFARLLGAALTLGLLFTGCSGGEAVKEIDLTAVSKTMAEADCFEGELVLISDKVVEKQYDLTGVESAVVYLEPTGGMAEEVSLFKAKSGEGEKVKAMLEKRLTEQKTKFENYVPAEVFKIENAVLLEKGDYLGLVVATDPAAAEEAFDKAFA